MPHPLSPFKKPELLSPAGNLECFFAAVENGANAVYFGLKEFSARAGAENLTLDDAGKAIAYSRQRSVKVYVALNTLIKTHELENITDTLVALEELRPDALIIQDLGLLYLIQSQFPHFTLHASTQMAVHNLAGVQQLGSMGFQRAVLARELSISEINAISKNVGVEIEVFIHGALCYSYSGLCFFSSMIGGRSGNRGRCAQPCRMRYTAQSGEEGYLFSMKDLSTLSHVNELIAAGIHSFKIEGRMKSPEYVAVVTNVYRQAIDGNLPDREDAVRLMKSVFSRETTHAYLAKENGRQGGGTAKGGAVKPPNMINPLYPANMGAYTGEVVSSGKGRLTIRADAALGARDLLQVFGDTPAKPDLLHVKNITIRGKRAFEIAAGEVAAIDSERQYKPGTRLWLLSSHKVKEAFALKIPKKLPGSKIPVNLEVKVTPDGIGIKGKAHGTSCEKYFAASLKKSIQSSINEDTLRGCFSRLGETPFILADIRAEISEDLFVPISVLNEIRRDYFRRFAEAWQNSRRQRKEEVRRWLKENFACKNTTSTGWHGQTRLSVPDLLIAHAPDNDSRNAIEVSFKIDTPQYLQYLPLEKINKIYVALNDKTVFLNDILKESGKSGIRDKVVFSLPVILRDNGDGCATYKYFKKTVQGLRTQGFRKYQASNLGALGLFEGLDVQLYADYPLYCLNPLSSRELKELGFHRYTLSPEDGGENAQTLFAPDAEMVVYQDVPLFTSETCVWANMKGNCPGRDRCDFERITVKNEHGDRFQAINEDCRTLVIAEKPFSIIHHVPGLIKAGQTNFRIDLCHRRYTPEMIRDVFQNFQDAGKVRNSIVGNFERGLL